MPSRVILCALESNIRLSKLRFSSYSRALGDIEVIMYKILIITVTFSLLTGCAGSPARVSFQSVEEIYKENIAGLSLDALCSTVDKVYRQRYGLAENVFNKSNKAIDMGFRYHGATRDYCDDPAAYHYQKNWIRKEYKIDRLNVVTETAINPPLQCDFGQVTTITLNGVIGPDSSFAIDRLLEQSPHCQSANGKIVQATIVKLESAGGLLEHGYQLGRILRNFGAQSYIVDNKICASSCAVAFLGGQRRILYPKGSILFHAPYFNQINAFVGRDPNCDVGEKALQEMKSYFVEMTNIADGSRLFDRTMSYCSSDAGWTVTGQNAAKLYGIATE